jgi:hypothetical protein
MVKVKKAGGGHRLQRAMVLSSGKLRFVKNKGGSSSRKRRKPAMAKRRRRSVAIARRRHSHRRYHHRRRRRGGGAGMSGLLPAALVAAGAAYVTGKSGPKQVTDIVNKIPGAKTFGPVTAIGGALWGIDKLGIYRSKWFKLAGVVAVVAAGIKVGTEGTSFKWVGDEYDMAGDDDMMMDVGDDDDLGDDELEDANE